MIWWKIQRLKAKDANTRLTAIEEMIAHGGLSVLSPIAEALKDDDPEVRAAAARGLGRLRNPQALPPLLSALTDRKAEVRASAVQALRHLGNPRAIEPLLQMLRDDSHSVRWHAAGALGALGWRPTSDTDFILRSVAMGHHEVAAGYGTNSVEILITALQDPDCPKRNEAAVALGKTGDSRAVKPLEAALQDNESNVRVAAIEGLSHLGVPESSDALLRCLSDSDHHVRAAAIEALGRMADIRIVDPIAASLIRDPAWEVRKLAVEALGRIRMERVTELLCQSLHDPDHDVRQTAAVSLGQVPDTHAIGPLVLALKDENSSVRQAAKGALRQIDRQWELSEGARLAIPQLEAALNHREYWVAQSAADTLAKINDARQRDLEGSAFSDPVRQRTSRAIAILGETLRDIDRDLRQAAAEALGRIVDDRVVPPLVAALDDRDDYVGRAAAFALNHLNWVPAPDDNRRAEKLKTLMQKT